MNRGTTFKIILAISLIVLLFIVLLFEIREVADYDWQKRYRYDSDEPYDALVFSEMIAERFDSVVIIDKRDDLSAFQDTTEQNALHILLAPSVNISGQYAREYIDFLARGNQSIIITNYFNLSHNEQYLPVYNIPFRDSILHITLDDSRDTFRFIHYDDDFSSAKLTFINALSPLYEESIPIIGNVQDDNAVMSYLSIGDGCLYYYYNPLPFANVMSKQEDYLPHFNQTFSRFDPDQVILDHPSKHKFGTSRRGSGGSGGLGNDNGINENTPLAYVMLNPSLRWAYYLLLATLLLYVIFRGKRRQKVIPILPKNENTSLEFVETLSHLYKSQNQNAKLVPHMKDIFINKVRAKYFLDYNDPDFAIKLSKKSKIDIQEIEVLMTRFENAENNYSFSDDQFLRLNQRLDTFYNNCK